MAAVPPPTGSASRWNATACSAASTHATSAITIGRSPSTLIPAALTDDRFRPLAAGDRGEAVGRRHKPVPRLAAGRDDGVVALPDTMAELILAQVLPARIPHLGS